MKLAIIIIGVAVISFAAGVAVMSYIVTNSEPVEKR